MLRSTVKASDRFGEISDELERQAIVAVDAGTAAAAEVAQANASIGLDLEIVFGHPDLHSLSENVAGGIKSRRQSSTKGKTTPIALFFDKGTLGNRKGKLSPKTRRRQSWPVSRGGTKYTAHRQAIRADEGIPAERFFLKARLAGRKALLARLGHQ